MLILGMIAAFLAAALHVFIFYIESFAWTTRALSVFGMDRESAEATKEMAFNQGFYNLFLAIEAFVGIAVYFLASPTVGLPRALWRRLHARRRPLALRDVLQQAFRRDQAGFPAPHRCRSPRSQYPPLKIARNSQSVTLWACLKTLKFRALC